MPERAAHPLECAVGIERYVADPPGIGGRLRERPVDFRVRERERFDAAPVDADPGDYPYLVVRATLRNRETGAFARALTDAMGASRARVDWAGTKDKRAVTTQLFTVRDADPGDLPGLRDVDLEVVGRAGRAIEFGDLAGNDFTVVVRGVERPERAGEITGELRAFGGGRVAVPNYFGQQRFGSRRPVTHEVGLRIVREDWEGAVLTYVADASEHEPEGTRAAREYVAETRDWEGALDRFPRRLGHERTLLQALAECDDPEPGPAAFRAALERLPWNLQRLFVNAAQSWAFNRILGRRLERGLPFHEPVVGDVVCFADEVDGLAVPDADRTQRVTERRRQTVARHCGRGRAFVTAPLIGTETAFADGEPGEIERAVLDEIDLAPGDFDLPGTFHSTGTRRAVAVFPDPAVSAAADEGDGGTAAGDPDDAPDALQFAFSLPKGSYATVLLREYLQASPLDL